MFRMYFIPSETANPSVDDMLCKAYFNEYTATGAKMEVRIFTGFYADCSRMANLFAKREGRFVYTATL